MHDFLQSNNFGTLLIKCKSNDIIVKQNILYVNIYAGHTMDYIQIFLQGEKNNKINEKKERKIIREPVVQQEERIQL